MLSIIIPCYNEEKLVKKTILEVLKAIKFCKIKKYEIVFIDDGSKDRSLQIVKQKLKKSKKIRIYENEKNFGIGYVFFRGVKLVKGNYLILIPSDNSHKSKEISKMINFYNKNYDLVTTYYKNSGERRKFRKIFTQLYTPLLNIIYGINLPYYNGLTLFKSKLLKKLKIKNKSFSYQIEIFVKLFHTNKIKMNIIPTMLNDRKKGSKAFRFKNAIQVIIAIIRIFFVSLILRSLKLFNHSKN
jgi:glycosyltransferase involved in cell wall biosynthesis